MMDWTDRHCRFFHRLLSRRARLYTEMVTAEAVLRGDRNRLLAFSPTEHPVALQLGGSEPEALAEAAKLGEAYGYDEINLNVGCPSDRVQEGRFGACLMAEPQLVARAVAAMRRQLKVPVTVKCRIGIDDQDSERDLDRFIRIVADAGSTSFIVHARKAWLKGLSPRQNRELPPLNYPRVWALKAAHPELEIIINGGITTLAAAAAQLTKVDGVAIGRSAYQNPYLLADVDRQLFGDGSAPPSRAAVLEALIAYVEEHMGRGGRLNNVTRHILGLCHGQPHARAFRRHLAQNAPRPGAGIEVLRESIALIEDDKANPARGGGVAPCRRHRQGARDRLTLSEVQPRSLPAPIARDRCVAQKRE
jgi:tRNA-dihydrouridine synthase A